MKPDEAEARFALDVHLLQGDMPDEARFVRRIGCPKTRQFDVLELGYHLYIHEIGTDKTNIILLNTLQLFRRSAVALIKSNDGMGFGDALLHALQETDGFQYANNIDHQPSRKET